MPFYYILHMSSNLSSSFLSKFFNAISNGISNKNSVLDRSVHTGMMNVPYASMGLITVAVGTFTYVTYMDYISDNVTETLDYISDNVTETLDDKPQDENSEYSFDVLNSLGISSDEPKIQENAENNNIFFPNTNPEETKSEVPVPEVPVPVVPVPEVPVPEVPVPEEQQNKKENQPGERYSIGGNKKNAHKKTNKKRR